MFGFYAYGISMGMDIRDIAKIVNTPQGRAITKLCEGDITNGQMGAFSALQAIGKLEGNIARDLTQFDVVAKKGEYAAAVTLNEDKVRRTASEVVQTLLEDYYNNVVRKYNFKDLTKVPFIQRNKGKINMDTKNLSNIVYQISGIGKMDDCIKYIQKSPLWEQIFAQSELLSNKDHWNASIYQLLDFCKNYGKLVKTYYSSDEGQEDFYYAKNLRILAQGAEEMRVLGTILSSNKGLKSRMEEGINFVNTIENAIIDRKKVMGIDADPEDHIDFVTFATDARYRQEAINKYETVKHTTNILDVVANAPHFLSYLRACAVPQAAFKMGSMKFRVRDKFYDKVVEENKLTSKSDKDNAIRGIENAVNYRMLREWLADEQFKFVLPKGSKMFVGRNQEPITVEDDTIIPLWDDNGLATFKLYMDSQIIPNLKSNASYSHNHFVQGLIPFELTKTGTHAAISAYTLEGSMMPQTESQTIQMENYLADFSQMYNFAFPNSKVPGINNIPSYADAFYIYSQYVFSGRKGQRSLMSLFDSENCTLAKHFETFEAQKDANETYDFQIEDLLPWCAPNSNIYHPSANMFYATDSKNFGKQLYRQRKEKLDPTNDESTATHMVVTRANKETAPIEARQNYTNPESNDAGSETNPHKMGQVNANVIPYEGDPIILDENSGEMVDIVTNEFSGSFQAVPRMPLSPRSQKIVDYVNNNIAEFCQATYDFESNGTANSISKVMLNALFEEAQHQIDNDC